MITRLIPRLLLVIAISAAAGFAFHASNRPTNEVSDGNTQRSPRPKPNGAEAKAWLFNQRAYPSGSIPLDAAEKGWRASMAAIGDEDPLVADNWTSIGPDTMAGGQLIGPTINPHVTGRIVDIAVDQTPGQGATHWFVAAEGGGIWETTNAGVSWTPKTDAAPTLGMTTISIAPSNPQILFAGTRDFSTGVGLMKSTDGGANWSIVNQNFRHPIAVKVHSSNPLIVLGVGTQSGQGGVFKSFDGGSVFFLKLAGLSGGLGIHPTNFNQQYAAVRGSGGGVFRSTDGGDNWMPISGPWSSAISLGGGAVKIAVAPSNPNWAYIVVPGGGMWKTENAWAPLPIWAGLPAAPFGFTHAEAAVVDPGDHTVFYAGGGGESFYRYLRGRWQTINWTHHDQRVLAATDNTLLLGNDGGFWTSTNQGASWENKNTNLSTVQFYAGSLHPTNATASLAGSLDNGSELWNGIREWEWVFFGDGGYSAFASAASDPDHNWLVSHIFMDIWKGVITGPAPYWQDFYPVATPVMREGAAFIAPIKRSPNGDTILAGSNNLWRADNFFTAGSPTWSANSPEMGTSITAIAFAPSVITSQRYAFGLANGGLWRTVDAGQNWSNLDNLSQVPDRGVTGIAIHPTDPAIMYVALSGFNSGGPPGHIFRTYNGSATNPQWIDVSPPVDLPMNALAIDPVNSNTIYAAADMGVWKSTNSGDAWTFMGPAKGMPNAQVFDLVFSPVDNLLVAYTFGRGAFKLNVGSLQVTILPAAAVTAGAKWKVDNGTFQNSGATVVGLAPGNHTVSFSPVAGYQTPANQSVVISHNQTTQATGIYSPWW